MTAVTLVSAKGAKQFQGLFDVIQASATVDVATLADAAGATVQLTGVTGAALGDFVLVSFGVDLVDMTVSAYVQAAGVVEIRVQNESGAVSSLASTTVRVIVLHPRF